MHIGREEVAALKEPWKFPTLDPHPKDDEAYAVPMGKTVGITQHSVVRQGGEES